MPIPEITHLQYLVLGTLLDGELSGREVRERIAETGVHKSGPAFYQFMSRLEDAKCVTGSYSQKIVQSQIIKERKYKITGAGIKAVNDTRRFYETCGGIQLGGLGLQSN